MYENDGRMHILRLSRNWPMFVFIFTNTKFTRISLTIMLRRFSSQLHRKTLPSHLSPKREKLVKAK